MFWSGCWASFVYQGYSLCLLHARLYMIDNYLRFWGVCVIYIHIHENLHVHFMCAGSFPCLLEINLMVGNSIRPCCWIHPGKIHQQSGGHFSQQHDDEGTFFTARTKGRRNRLELQTGFRGSHLCRRGAVSRGSREMAKLTKTVKVKADPCEIMHVIYS